MAFFVVIACPRCELDEKTLELLILFYHFSEEVWFRISSELNCNFLECCERTGYLLS